MALKVVRNEIDGWDVVREDENVALSNHTSRESAEAAAEMRAQEEHIGESGGEPVKVDTEHVHEIDDTREGVRPAMLWGAGLLTAVVILIVVLALTGSLTGFGS